MCANDVFYALDLCDCKGHTFLNLRTQRAFSVFESSVIRLTETVLHLMYISDRNYTVIVSTEVFFKDSYMEQNS